MSHFTPHVMTLCIVSDWTKSEGEVSAPLWNDVALLPEQAQQQVLCVLGPTEDPGALEPVGDMSL